MSEVLVSIESTKRAKDTEVWQTNAFWFRVF